MVADVDSHYYVTSKNGTRFENYTLAEIKVDECRFDYRAEVGLRAGKLLRKNGYFRFLFKKTLKISKVQIIGFF